MTLATAPISSQRILYFQSSQPLAPFSEACLSLTPKVFVTGQHEAYLDIEGTKKLFGGEKKILNLAQELETSFSLKLRRVLTDRIEWARPLAMEPDTVIAQGKSQKHLFQLPIERLAYCGDPSQAEETFQENQKLTAFMRRVGMTQIVDFAKLNTTAIGRRFGEPGIQLYQWIWGEKNLCLSPFSPTEPIRESLQTDEITSLEMLLFYLRQILVKTEARLRGRSLLAKQLKLTFYLDWGEPLSKTLDLSEPLREASVFLKILQDFLRQTTWSSPLQTLELEVTDTIAFTPGQLSLFDTAENRLSDLSQFIERWQNRYGKKSVGFAHFENSHLPEKSWTVQWPPKKKFPLQPIEGKRPLFLYSPPRPHSLVKNTRLEFSESLASEWWEQQGFRQYFIAHLPQGERQWIFWDLEKQQWFLHGNFD